MDSMVGGLNLSIPDLSEPVVGFRSWNLDDGRLRGPYYKRKWTREMTAGCKHSDERHPHDKSPVAKCQCGLYMYWPLPDGSLPKGAAHGSIRGGVVAWGKLAVHETGLRAERARIVCLVEDVEAVEYMALKVDGNGRAALRKLASHYRVPVIEPENLIQFASEFGTPVPESIMERVRVKNAEREAERERATQEAIALAESNRKRLAAEHRRMALKARWGPLAPIVGRLSA